MSVEILTGHGLPNAPEGNPLRAALSARAMEIEAALDADKKPWAPRNHREWNWASEIGHPCMKHLVHCRLDWEQKKPMNADGMWRVEEGMDQEWKIKKLLGELGLELRQNQVALELPELRIRGKIDGLLPLDPALPGIEDLQEIPAEVKSVNPAYWDKLKTIEDVKQHSAWWIRKYPSQLNLYLAMTGKPCGILALKTWGKKPRLLPMVFDQDLFDRDAHMARTVNAHVEAETYPEPMPYDPSTCGMCGFEHLCKPLTTSKFIEIPESEEPELEFYLELKEQKKNFEELHRRLIGTSEKPGRYHGKDGIVGGIQIQTKISHRNYYEIPDEVKAPYAEKREVVTTTIERITD